MIRPGDSEDPFKKPTFSKANRIRRLAWQITWRVCCQWTPKPLHAWRVAILRMFGANIGASNAIYPTAKIWAPWLLTTEDTVTIGPGVEVYNPGGVLLQDHCILSQDCYICGATHDYNSADFTYISRKIVIGTYAWICARAIVLPGVTCNAGSVLAAGSVTSKDLDSWSVYAGNPAVKVKARKNSYE